MRKEKKAWLKPSETRNIVRAKKNTDSSRRLYKLQAKIIGHAVAFPLALPPPYFLLPRNYFHLNHQKSPFSYILSKLSDIMSNSLVAYSYIPSVTLIDS